LSGNDNIHNEAHYVASNIPIFFRKMLNLFAASIHISPLIALSGAETIFRQGGNQTI